MERNTLNQGLVGVDANGAPDLQLDRIAVSRSNASVESDRWLNHLLAQVHLGHRNDLYGTSSHLSFPLPTPARPALTHAPDSAAQTVRRTCFSSA